MTHRSSGSSTFRQPKRRLSKHQCRSVHRQPVFFGQAAETWRHTIDPNVMGSVDLWQDPRHGCEEDPSGEFNALYYDFKSKIADVTEA